MTFSNHINYNCKVTLDTGEEYLVNANWLHNSKNDEWPRWHCDTGKTRILIDSELNVYNGQCFNDFLGNINTEWSLLPEGTICKRSRCSGCADDLMTRKFKGE